MIQKTLKYYPSIRHFFVKSNSRNFSNSTMYYYQQQSSADNLPVPSTGARPGKVYQPLYNHGEYRTKAQMEQPQFTIPGTTHYEMPEHLKQERNKSKYILIYNLK